jgi:hypothetical protein
MMISSMGKSKESANRKQPFPDPLWKPDHSRNICYNIEWIVAKKSSMGRPFSSVKDVGFGTTTMVSKLPDFRMQMSLCTSDGLRALMLSHSLTTRDDERGGVGDRVAATSDC